MIDAIETGKPSKGKPSDQDVTAALKEKSVGWISDPISELSEIGDYLEKRVAGIEIVLLLAFVFCAIGAVLSVIILIVSIEDAVWDSVVLFGILLALFTLILVFSIRGFAIGQVNEALKMVSRAFRFDPQPEVPQGRNAVDRFLKYLSLTDERFAKSMSKVPRKLELGVNVKGKSGKVYHVDAKMFDGGGFGRSRFRMLLKVFKKRMTRVDAVEYKKEIDDIFTKHGSPPTRVFAIQTEGDFDEDLLEFIDTEWLVWPWGSGARVKGRVYRGCPIEVIRESDGGIYDFGIFYFG